MISPAPPEIILCESPISFTQGVRSDRHDFVALAMAPSTFPRLLGANAAQAFPSEFDAGGVMNKARPKIAITLARPCNSEIAPNNGYSSHREIRTDVRQPPAKPSRRLDSAYREIVRNYQVCTETCESLSRARLMPNKRIAQKAHLRGRSQSAFWRSRNRFALRRRSSCAPPERRIWRGARWLSRWSPADRSTCLADAIP